jgi:hypothetical protein
LASADSARYTTPEAPLRLTLLVLLKGFWNKVLWSLTRDKPAKYWWILARGQRGGPQRLR